MNTAFRSHLMQQFVAVARHQSRTPIALIGWVKDGEEDPTTTTTMRSSPPASSTRQLSSISASFTAAPRVDDRHSQSNISLSATSSKSQRRRDMSTLSEDSPTTDDKEEVEDHLEEVREDEEEKKPAAAAMAIKNAPYNEGRLVASFQSILQTRRTTSKYRTLSEASPPAPGMPPLLTREQYRAALDRAVLSGRAAPNHKRTEPFSFKRLLAPSKSTARLADIAEQVYLRQKLNAGDSGEPPDQSILDAAQRKHDKWFQIPVFLVTLVSTKANSEHSPAVASALLDEHNIYDPLPYSPPTSERALEDYAAACAATQNVLLSLHAEGLASKVRLHTVLFYFSSAKLMHVSDFAHQTSRFLNTTSGRQDQSFNRPPFVSWFKRGNKTAWWPSS